MALTHLGCPSCGGAVALGEGQRLVACRYCGREALAVIPEAVPRYVVALVVGRAEAAAAARSAFAAPALPPALPVGGPGAAWALCYVPFYEVTGTHVGTFLHRETVAPRLPIEQEEQGVEMQMTGGTEPEKVERTDTRVLERDFLRIVPACDLADMGLDRIRLGELRRQRGGVHLEPYDLIDLQTRAVVFSPSRSPEHARAAGGQAARPDIRVIEQRVKILYYPVWHGRYRYGGRAYGATIDGVTGELLAAHAPLRPRRAAAALAGSLALAALWLGRLLHQLPASRGPSLEGVLHAAVLLAGGAAALLVAAAAWRVIRRGGELAWCGETRLWVPAGEPGGVTSLSGLLESLIAGGRAAGAGA
jgi:hypothetical protein